MHSNANYMPNITTGELVEHFNRIMSLHERVLNDLNIKGYGVRPSRIIAFRPTYDEVDIPTRIVRRF